MKGKLQAKEIAYAKAQRQEYGTFRKTHVIPGGLQGSGSGNVIKLEHEQGLHADSSTENALEPEGSGTLWKYSKQRKDLAKFLLSF